MSAFSFSSNLNPLSRHRTSNRTNKKNNWAISVLDLTIGRPVPKLKSHGFRWEKLTGVSLTCASSRTWRQHKSDQSKGSIKKRPEQRQHKSESKAGELRSSGTFNIRFLQATLFFRIANLFIPCPSFCYFVLPRHFLPKSCNPLG